MTATAAQTGVTETPLEKAARIAQMTPMGTGGSQFDDSLIRRQLELQEKANKMNSILKFHGPWIYIILNVLPNNNIQRRKK